MRESRQKTTLAGICTRTGALLLLLSAISCAAPDPCPETVVLVTVDTLRADHLGSYGYPRDVSGFMDRLAAEGVRFDNAFAASSTTITSHASLFTSLFPNQHRLLRNGENLHESLFTMAELFRAQGYQTAAFTTVGFIRSLDRGFETFDSESTFHPASHVVDKALGWLDSQAEEGPLFLWVHLFDVHEWYKPEHLDEAFRGAAAQRSSLSRQDLLRYYEEVQGITVSSAGGEEELFDVVDRYDDQILSVDRQLELFYEALETRGRNDDALWILTSDHGEGLGSHGFLGHGAKIYNEQVRIPLIFHFTQGRHAGNVVDRLVRHVDLLPTLAELLDTPLDQQAFPVVGESLGPLLENPHAVVPIRYSFSQRREADERRLRMGWEPGDVYGLQTATHKYILKSEAEDEFYDLVNDPTESRNLISEPSKKRDQMGEFLRELFLEMNEQGNLLGRSEILPERIEELKALGYL